MLTFNIAWRCLDQSPAPRLLTTSLPGTPPWTISADAPPARLALLDTSATAGTPADPAALEQAPTPLAALTALGRTTALACFVDPACLTIAAAAQAPTLHYVRLADATVKPLAPVSPLLTCLPGDSYIAVTARLAPTRADSPGGLSAAVARFIHLRDYFNADKLARALLDHLADLGAAPAPSPAVLVIEAR